MPFHDRGMGFVKQLDFLAQGVHRRFGKFFGERLEARLHRGRDAHADDMGDIRQQRRGAPAAQQATLGQRRQFENFNRRQNRRQSVVRSQRAGWIILGIEQPHHMAAPHPRPVRQMVDQFVMHQRQSKFFGHAIGNFLPQGTHLPAHCNDRHGALSSL